VSTKHAEIRVVDGRCTLRDLGSTNGTFVNGVRIADEFELHPGDRVSFGEHGPQVEYQPANDAATATPPATSVASPAGPGASPPPAAGAPRRPTSERIAVAVEERTHRLTQLLVFAIVVLGGGVGIAYWAGHRESSQEVSTLRQALAQNESTMAAMDTRLRTLSDTGYVNALSRRNQALRAQLEQAPSGSVATIDSLRHALAAQGKLVAMDVSRINDRNAPAVALLVSELDGRPFAGTAFAISKDGLLITNRHNVKSDAGNPPTRIAIKFRDSGSWLPAHLVRASDDPDVDLALVQMDAGSPFPTIAGISASDADAREGAPVVTIGFPHAMDLPMEGHGNDFVAKTSLDPGTVSKRVTTVLQIDSYAGHGSSGSPVFGADGRVVGVVWGGPAEAAGRIVYAVPAQKVLAFLGSAGAPLTR
jgi:S1-C subfamily serine protease